MEQSLSTRVAARIELMEGWVKNGIPTNVKDIPSSLNGWRTWHRPDLGILRIGSKTSFTKTDPGIGIQVVRIDALMSTLNQRLGVGRRGGKPTKQTKRSYKPEKIRRLEAERERDALKTELVVVSGQWHEARSDLERRTKELESVRVINADLRRTIREREHRIEHLLGELRSAGLREM
ncbi:hypothetical protein [Rhizobium oryziradicis]|nr:hypothetical protein [Rhizobium oryziradicis]